MKILFLHGWQSVPGGVKPSYLKDHGHEIVNPALPDEDFAEAVRIAQAEFDHHRPQVIVGSSRGGAVAMTVHCGDVRLVLLCPAWKKWGTIRAVKSGTVILHSRADNVIPFADSLGLIESSGLPASALIEVGSDHRLADPESLAAMLAACDGRPSDEYHNLPCCGRVSVRQLKELPHLYGTDFALVRCLQCEKPWVGYWCGAGGGGGWEPVSDADAARMLVLADSELAGFMRKWANDFN